MTTNPRTLLLAATLALASWFSGLALLAYAFEPSREVIAWAPPSRAAAITSEPSVSIVNAQGAGFLRLRSDSPGLVRSLYSRGAWLVLPASFGGCRFALPLKSRSLTPPQSLARNS